VIDSKHYQGRLELDRSGRVWHGRYPLAPHLRAVDGEADLAAQVLVDPGVVVVPWPFMAPRSPGKVVMNGVPVVAARVCRACFVPFRRWWVPSGSPGWPTRPGSASTPPPDLETRVRDSLKVSPCGAPAWLPPCLWPTMDEAGR
jgi:hypothetical protein